MKVETIVSEKKFEPITFNVTVESMAEVCLLWCRLNVNRNDILQKNNYASKIVQEIKKDQTCDTYSFFSELHKIVKGAGLTDN